MGHNKREAIKLLKFSPRVTRSKTKAIQNSYSYQEKQDEEDETGSCSVNIVELEQAYSIGRSIGSKTGERGIT